MKKSYEERYGHPRFRKGKNTQKRKRQLNTYNRLVAIWENRKSPLWVEVELETLRKVLNL